jgi:thiamine pyrophosphokinase
LFELFEYSKTSFKTYSNAHYASFLAEVIQSSSTEMKTSLLENLNESKYFKSYSFVSSLTESSQIKMNGLVYSLDKLIMNCVKFFTELNASVEKQNLINQNLLVKLVQFIKNWTEGNGGS